MSPLDATPPNFADCLTIGEAAEFLGVSAGTLRNWDRSGKLKSRRHPHNGYRIYLHEDLEAVLRSADLAKLTDESLAPQVDWSKLRNAEHFVQFYETDEYLIESLSGFVGAALRASDASIVIATPEHRRGLRAKLAARGVDVAEAESAGRYMSLDAADTLAKFMVDGSPDPTRFEELIGNSLANLGAGKRRIHAFGEMVALLWAEGNHDAAIELEQMWNKLAERYTFALCCAYSMAEFDRESQADGFDGICGCHSRIIPAESYSTANTVDDRLRAISRLQQKAQSLDAEIKHRKEVEKVLSTRDHDLADFLSSKDRAQAHSRLRILVVDDNQDASRTLCMLLQIKGYEVHSAIDGLEAVAAAESFRPDLILMDVGMPKLNGYEATRRIRETEYGKQIFIVALTGWGQPENAAQSIEAGCSAHLVKPVDFAELEKLLSRINTRH